VNQTATGPSRGSANQSESEPTPTLAARSTPIAPPSASAAILETAFGLLGTKYKFGGTTPDTGFDCSGFVGYVLRQHGIDMPRTVAEQFSAGRPVAQDDIQAGDLVFFTTTGPGATHIGIVVSAGAEWKFVHAPADGASVRIERFDTGYWQQRWIGARRIF
jgi:cell wall-associated NlpC family hydrolase